MNEIIFQTYMALLPTLMGYIVWLLKRQKKDRDANSKGTMLLLRVQLIEYHDKYIELGYISSNAYSNFCEMYEHIRCLPLPFSPTKIIDLGNESNVKLFILFIKLSWPIIFI